MADAPTATAPATTAAPVRAISPGPIPRRRSARICKPASRSINTRRPRSAPRSRSARPSAGAWVGPATRFASLELGCEEGIQGGNCDNGYSCAYSNSISWRTPSTPNPPEIRPRAVFERLFGSPELDPGPGRRARMERYHGSILDSVMEDTRRLQGSLGVADRRKIDEYLYAVRE